MSRLFSFLLFFSFALTILPLSASASGLIPCGRTSGTASEMAPCTLCHIVIGGKGIIDYGMQIMTVTAIAVIVAMALFYIVSTGNEGMMSTAKSGIKASLIGFAVMLSAWLLVNVILTLLVNTTFLNGIKKNNTFTFSCDSASSAGTATTTQTPPTLPPSNNTTPFCGDGIQNGTEACDDGDSTHGDGNGANCSKDCSTFCTKNTCVANGSCGTATTGNFTFAPAENLCATGKATTVSLKNGAWSWTCSGVNGGTQASCTASKNTDTGPDDPGIGGGGGNGGSCPGVSIPFSGTCPGFASTTHYKLDWGATSRIQSFFPLSWGVGQIVVISFTTPNQIAPNDLGNIDYTERFDPPTYRTAVLSKTPCDLTNGLGTNEGISGPINYSVGPNSTGQAVLEPNTTYYYSIVNRQNGVESCLLGVNGGTANCGARIQFTKPKNIYNLPAGTPNYSNASCTNVGGVDNWSTWNKTCPGFAQTYVLNLDWKAGAARNYWRPFAAGSVGVVSFVTPASPTSKKSRLDIAEASGSAPATPRIIAVSKTPCDFSNLIEMGMSVSPSFVIDPNESLQVDNVTWSLHLKPNTRYYFNVANRVKGDINSADACQGVCDTLVDFYPNNN